MKISPSHLLLALAPFLLANCRSTSSTGGGRGSDTPDHNMSQAEYPFDEDGNYREDWVKGGGSSSRSSNKVVDMTVDNPPSPFLGTTDSRDWSPPKVASSGSSSKKTTYKKPTSKTTTKKTVAKKSPPKKPVAKSTTITLKKGDTLYGLANRYGTTVKAIQSANGMGSSTALRDGKSLKIPR